MSIVICDNCEHYIDSDFDCDCFVEMLPESGLKHSVLCEWCRDKVIDYIVEEA